VGNVHAKGFEHGHFKSKIVYYDMYH